MVNIQLAREAGGGVAVLDPQLAPRAVAIGVHRGLGHPQFAGDLFGRQMLVDQAKAFTLARREQPHHVFGDHVPCAHSAST
jgi:hypothetical protein